MIRKSREGFINIYGDDEKQFERKLYERYDYDRELSRRSARGDLSQVGKAPNIFDSENQRMEVSYATSKES